MRTDKFSFRSWHLRSPGTCKAAVHQVRYCEASFNHACVLYVDADF